MSTSSGVTAVSQNVTTLTNVCLFCGFSHSFKVCRKLRKVMHKEKITFLMKHKLCFGCLGGDHMKSQCTQKATSDVCKGSHPTLLHRSTATDNNAGQSPGSSSESSHFAPLLGCSIQSDSTVPVVTSAVIQEYQSRTDTMPIVPVKVKLASGDLEVLTHAFLDSGSSETFITERLMKQLSASGKKIHISLTTLNNDDILTPCYKVSGMEVCGLNEDCYISLPAVFTQVSLPVSREQVPSQEDIERWPHLSPVVVSSLQAGVDLLISNNVPKATEPWEVINSVNDGPYAVGTVLGWSINGPLRSPTGSDDWNQAVSCRVQVTSRLKDQLQKFFSLDFSKQFVFSGEKALSVEDKKFMEMVNRETILQDGITRSAFPWEMYRLLCPTIVPWLSNAWKDSKRSSSPTVFFGTFTPTSLMTSLSRAMWAKFPMKTFLVRMEECGVSTPPPPTPPTPPPPTHPPPPPHPHPHYEELPSEKALGVLWAVESDLLGCHVSVPDKPVTRRGILSVVSSVYDPLGMVAPFVLQGKVLVQELWRWQLGWDDKIPDEIVLKWQQWLQSLPYLDKFVIPRCYQPEGFGDLASVELHQFADASEIGYACVSFLRLKNRVGRVTVPLLSVSWEWLHWSRWPSHGWSWQLLWLLSKLPFSFRLSLISHWRIPTSGLTAHQFLATSGMRRLDTTPLLPTELLWLENTLLRLSGITVSPKTFLPRSRR